MTCTICGKETSHLICGLLCSDCWNKTDGQLMN